MANPSTLILITLTGRAQHGKDSTANFGIEKYSCTAKFALADWLKESASRVFNIPLRFFNENKDTAFQTPIVLNQDSLRRIIQELKQNGCPHWMKIPTSRWLGRQLSTPRDILVWFSEEIIKPNLGNTVYCDKVRAKILSLPETPGKPTVIFVTDCRFPFEVTYFEHNFPNTYPIKIVRPGMPQLNHSSEVSVDQFQADAFFAILDNEGTLEDLSGGVVSLLTLIRDDMKNKYPAGVPVASAAPAVEAGPNVEFLPNGFIRAGTKNRDALKARFPHLGDNPSPEAIRQALKAAEQQNRAAEPVRVEPQEEKKEEVKPKKQRKKKAKDASVDNNAVPSYVGAALKNPLTVDSSSEID